jgi:hypothetical protein
MRERLKLNSHSIEPADDAATDAQAAADRQRIRNQVLKQIRRAL